MKENRDFPAGVQVRPARKEDIPALRRLFKEVFGESENGLSLFFSRAFSPARTVAALLDGSLCGMFYILPASLRCTEETLPAAYLYALAVSPERRGQGVAGAILRYLEEYLPSLGYQAAVLVPATSTLFDYYARFGYTSVIPAGTCALRAADLAGAALPGVSVEPSSLNAMSAQREHLLGRYSPLFWWEADMLRYTGDYIAATGGETVRVRAAGLDGYAAFYRDGGALEVREAAGENLPALLQALLAFTGAQTLRAHLPADSALRTQTVPYAAVRWLDRPRDTAGGYMALALE